MNKRYLRILWNIDFFISGLCIMTLVLITMTGVIARYVLNSPFTWLEEVQFILTVQAAFWGASVAFKKGGHIAIEVFVESFPKKIQQIAEIIIAAIVFITLFFIVKQQINRSISLYISGRKTYILNFPAFLNYAIVSLACISMIIHFAIFNYKKIFYKNTITEEEN